MLMRRSLKIKVKYQLERKYEEVEEEAKGFQARVMQQAHDHLEAIDPLMLAKEITIMDQQLK